MEHKISKRVYSLNMIRIPFIRWEEPGVPVMDEVSGCFVGPEDVCPVALRVFGQAGLVGGLPCSGYLVAFIRLMYDSRYQFQSG
jgi:hypothetical protein